MISLCLTRIRLSVLTTNHPTLVRLFYLVFLLVLLVGASRPYAEIYCWQDNEGVVRYSNTPPEDHSKIIDVIPTRRVPLIQDDNGAVYYLNIPDTRSTRDMPVQDVLDELTLPPEVLEELLNKAPQSASSPDEVFSEDLGALTFRLAELEGALEREITNRLGWEQQYLKSQSRTNSLEQQNQMLQAALTQMEAKMEKMQKAVALSEIHVTALREPQQQLGKLEHQIGELQAHVTNSDPQQELDTLKDKLIQLQAYVTDMNAQTGQHVTKVQTTIDDIQATHDQQLEALSDSASEVVAKLSEQEHVFRTVTAHQNWQIHEQQAQIEQLRAELGLLKKQIAESSLVRPMAEKSPQEMIPAVRTEPQQDLAALLEKNTFMEAFIKHQARALNMQKKQLQAVENKLGVLLNLQAKASHKERALLQRLLASGRIHVVERKIRRDTARLSKSQ